MPNLDSVVLKTRVILNGQVNGQDVSATGRAVLQPDEGITTGRYVLGDLPRGLHPRLLGAILITGYPTASKALAGAQNPFRTTSYGYTRKLDFGSFGYLLLNAYCRKEPGAITSTFQLTGQVDVPELTAMEPLVETWIPNGLGRVHAHFTGSWRSDALSDTRVFAECITEYQLESGELLKNRQHRFVTLHTTVDGKFMSKDQHVSLFLEFPGHRNGQPIPIDFESSERIDQIVEVEAARLRNST
jgi:hypothetical protein